MTPEISVIIPTRGRDELLKRAVESVFDQSTQDFEIIVVDDASQLAVKLPSHPRLRVFRLKERGGTAAARNRGILEARGRHFAFLDDDDYYLEGRLAKGLEALDRANVSVCWARSSAPATDRSGWQGRLEGWAGDTILDQRVPPIGTCTILRDDAPLFDERFTTSEDVEWWLRLAQHVSFTTVPLELYVIGVHEGTRKTGQTADRLRCRLQLLDQHAEYFASNPRAAAQQWKRAGGLAMAARDFQAARRAFWRSFKKRPGLRTALHLARSTVLSAAAGAPDQSD